MKQHTIEITKNAPTGLHRQNLLREYLQAEILYAMQRSGAFLNLAFVGGTALRFLYQLPRYSVDLDFSLENTQNYDFPKLVKKIETRLIKAGYRFSLKANIDRTVQSMTVKFEDLLQEAGLAAQLNQKLSIKIEIDCNPPAGADTDSTIIRKHFFLHLWHYHISSLFSGKIHALLTRKWTKGRDIYDLIWYLTLTNKVEPNFTHLNNALVQTGWKEQPLTPQNWKIFIADYLKKLDWDSVINDVRDFLENPEDVDLLDRNNVLSLLV
jgi:predicted nucleotidyltransferase component of viral defense system